MKYIIVYTLVCLHSFAWAQKSGNSNYHQTEIKNNAASTEVSDKTITISVNGLLNARADTYVAAFHVMQVGETAELTDALMTERINNFKSALRRAGIDTSVVITDMNSFVPKYDFNALNKLFSKTYNEVPDGFEMHKNVIIRYEKPSSLDVIITAAAGAEIYDLVKIDYFLNDIQKHYNQLRVRCMETLRDRMKSYEMVGVKLDTLKKTFSDDFGTVLPQQRYGQYQAVARPSMDAVKRSTGGASAKFRAVDLSPSQYYEPLSYEQYDVVINPVVDEPAVQLTYQIRMTFALDLIDEGPQKSIFIIGADGRFQQIDLGSQEPLGQ